MSTQKIINRSTYNRIKDRLNDPEQLNVYRSSSSFSEIGDNDLLGTTISLPDEVPELLVTENIASNDEENAIKVYSYLGPLTRTQAADPRLWTTLTHTTFWDYSKKRWPVANKSAEHVVQHWFEMKGKSGRALRRNAISRLWWAVNLTLAPWEKDSEMNIFKDSDRFKYTRILLAQQQNFQDILERSYGSNLRLRICLLHALGVHQPKVSNKNDLTKDVTKKITLLLKHRQLDAMNINDLMVALDSVVKNAAKEQLLAKSRQI